MKIEKAFVDNYGFFISEFSIETIFRKSDKDKFEDLNIDIDFESLHDNNNRRRLDLTFDVRPDKGKPGYIIKGNAEGIFILPDEILEDDEKLQNCLLYNCLPMIISSVRSYITNITSYSPHGTYTLPGIPVNVLIEEKSKQILGDTNQNPPQKT